MSKTINTTPTWPAAVRICLTVLESGNQQGKEVAREELIKMADNLQVATDTLTVMVVEKEVYGRPLVYPIGEVATGLAALLNVKSFNTAQLNGIRNLGYTVIYHTV